MDLAALELAANSPVILYLQSPKEKIWGLLLSVSSAGIVLRGLDLVIFDDWMRQEARQDEQMIGLSTIFYPMHRVERMERDETIGPILGYADRFAHEAGRTVLEALGVVPLKD
jgi:hypothetical protein